MSTSRKSPEAYRIALVWEDHRMQAQRTFNGICRRAGLASSVTLQCFDAFHLGFQRGIAKPLQQWKPDGVVVKLNRQDQLKMLRSLLPGIPFVSTLIVLPEAADTCVSSNIPEAILLARDHFRSQGVPHLAMFCSALPRASARRIAAFKTAVPDGFTLDFQKGDSPRGCKVVMQWLETLPKPVGVMAFEIAAGPFLLQRCQELGLRVPEDVQIIGADDDDVSLACDPHLTSIQLPGARIGETAMDTILRLLRKETPRPPEIIEVGGSLLITRASTGAVSAGSARISHSLNLMQTHLRQGVSVERLAEMSGMGLTNFYKEFGNAMGCTPAQYQRQLRIDEACRMLRETKATVTLIAGECGFKNLIAFVQFFRRQMGTTPTAYREQTQRETNGK